jgi:exonuclease VII large subunit
MAKSHSLFTIRGFSVRSLTLLTRFVNHKFQHAYYRTKESLGQHKRELVVIRVEEASESLAETQIYFTDALERFKAVVHIKKGSLEDKYYSLKRQFDFCATQSQHVSERIKAIENVTDALFLEWEKELKEYTNRSLRAQSRQQLKLSKQHYARLLKAMRKAEKQINPVLGAFRDQVLFLKHNLNAHAIAALQQEFSVIALDISQLILAMEVSISEANHFAQVLVEQKILTVLPPSKYR